MRDKEIDRGVVQDRKIEKSLTVSGLQIRVRIRYRFNVDASAQGMCVPRGCDCVSFDVRDEGNDRGHRG